MASDLPEATESVSHQTLSDAHLFIKQLVFSGGQVVDVERDAVVAIVGPNNSGKTRALLGINQSCSNATQSMQVCSGVFQQIGSVQQLGERLAPFQTSGSTWSGPSFNINAQHQLDRWRDHPSALGQLSSFFCVLLDTGSRLSGCQPVQPHSVGHERPANPIQMIYEDPTVEAKISKVFRELFDVDMILNARPGQSIPLYVGDRPPLENGEDLHTKSYLLKVAKLPTLHEQGDGMKSFGSILLNVSVMPRDIMLIDEPEAFLHPPQQRRMGRMLAEDSPTTSQIVLATHSESIIQGMLAGDSERVAIVRLTRKDNKNHAKTLSNKEVAELWKNPILRYSNILSGLFHDAVVVAESDADCRFFEAMADALPLAEGKQRPPDVFYTHSGGKDRMPIVIAALRGLDVPVRAVADVDVLREEELLKKFVTTLGGDWSVVQSDWKAVANAVEQSKSWFKAGDLKTKMAEILSKLGPEDVVPMATVRALKSLARQTSPWDEIKRNGLPGPLKGEPAKRAKALLDKLAAIGLFIPPVGELECFAKTLGNHGPRWVEAVLAKDLAKDPELQEARDFVGAMRSSLVTK